MLNSYRGTTMATTKTTIESFEQLLEYFHSDRWSMIHCAVDRKALLKKYKHHYIVLGYKWKSDIKVTVVIHYTKVGPCTGKVIMEHYNEAKFRQDIQSGLVVLEDDRYPKNDEQYELAYARFEEKKHDQGFSVRENNCDHLTTYILTGEVFSCQVAKMLFLERCILSACDCSVDACLRNASSFSTFQRGKWNVWRSFENIRTVCSQVTMNWNRKEKQS